MAELEAATAELFNLVCNNGAADVESFLSVHPTLPVDVQNDKGDTPLIMAARRGDTDVVRALLKAGASVHTRNLKGSNPLIAVSRAPPATSTAHNSTQHGPPPLTSSTAPALSPSGDRAP